MRILSLALVTLLLIPGTAPAQEVPAAALRAAAQKGLVLLEATSPTFIKKGGCNSCHNQSLPAAAQAFARRRGVPTGETIAQLPSELSEATLERFIEYAPGGGAGIAGLGYDLFARAVAGTPADERTHAQIYFVKSMQEPDGHWETPANRPPLTFGNFTSTAFVIKALKAFAPAVQAADTQRRIDRARAWLLQAQPKTTQERTFHLLGLVWSGADREQTKRTARELQATQRPDGGWAQMATMSSDAYATGMALYAMYESGAPVTDKSYQAGLRYLLSTQAPDGTWHVKTRSLPLQPYFTTGYPYEHDQWISSAGAAYATMAISAAVQAPRSAAAR